MNTQLDEQISAFDAWWQAQVGDSKQWTTLEYIAAKEAWQAAISQHKAVQDGYLLPSICVQRFIEEAERFGLEQVTFGVLVPDIGVMGLPDYRGVICEDVEVLRQCIAAAPSDSKALVESEKDKAFTDLIRYGQSFMKDGKHIPLESVLQDPPVDTVKQDAPTIKVKRKLFEFTSQQNWVNKAQSYFQNCGVRQGNYICVDRDGVVMRIGKHFINATKNNSYPVVVYELDDGDAALQAK
jgi:hypothetical protein